MWVWGETYMKKKPTFDGSTNLEKALNILPPEENDESVSADLVQVDDSLPDIISHPDEEIMNNIRDLHNKAVEAFEDGMDQLESIEPKYVPRTMEVSKQYLDAALDAVKLMQRQKEHNDKMALESAKLSGNAGKQNANTINNVIVADRNDILKKILKEDND